ncbi:LytTR family DNA-binding domain-containing protein [Spirosoma pulveris]
MKPLTVTNGLLALPGYPTPQSVAQIRWLEGQSNYTRIHLSGPKTPLLVCQTLKAFEKQLPAFLRAAKGALINPSYVKAVSQLNSKQMTIVLLDGHLIPVARRRIGEMATRLTLSPEKLITDRTNAGLTQAYPYPGSLPKARR